MMGMAASKCASPVDDRTTHPIHHAPKRDSGFPSRFALVASPTRPLAEELAPHLSPTVVGRSQFIRYKVVFGAPGPHFQPDHAQSGTGQYGGHQAPHGSYPYEYDVGRSSWGLDALLRS